MRPYRQFALLALAALALPARAESCADTNFSTLAASACMGSFSGDLIGSVAETAALSAQWGGSWAFAGRSDAVGNGPFNTHPQVAFSGTLGLDTPASGTFVVGLVAAGQFSWYRFQAAAPISSLTFDNTEGVATTPQGNPLSLSYAALYVSAVPEAGSASLLLVGLLTLSAVIAKRRG